MATLTGNSKLSKQINRSLILHSIRQRGSISRTDLASITGLTSGTVSNITNELLKEGIIITKGTTDSKGGRPKVLLEINSKSNLVLGVNIGGTKIVTLLTDLDGRVIRRHDEVLNREWSVINQINRIIETAHRVVCSEQEWQHIIGAGVGIPGLLNSKKGISLFSPNLGWRNLPIRRILEDELGIPVFIDNAVRLGALGEKWWGAGAEFKHIVALYVGTGVGAGMIIEDKIFRGGNEAAGEIGHVVVAEDGERCSCGKQGCLEAMASGPAIVRQANHLLTQTGQDSLLRSYLAQGVPLTGELVCEAAMQGDQIANEVMQRVGHYIGVGMAILINLFNPELLVFNGGVSKSWELIKDTVLETVENRAMPGQAQTVKIIPSDLGDSVGPLGAASLVIHELFSNPDSVR